MSERIDQVEPPTGVDDRIFEEVVRLRSAGIPAALATVIGVRGSSPAKAPMKVLIRDDGSTLGSVGGGCLEEEVKRFAREVLDEDRPARFSMRLTEDESPGGELICGGAVEVFVEPISAPGLILFGGGHVGRAVATLAARVGFRVVVTDDRQEYANTHRFPMAAEALVAFPEQAVDQLSITTSSYVLVMTRSHQEDTRILQRMWARSAKPRYLGMIGSKRKVKKAFEELQSAGVDPDWLARIRAPVGLAIGARTADEIAVAVVAEMIAVRRGSPERAPGPLSDPKGA